MKLLRWMALALGAAVVLSSTVATASEPAPAAASRLTSAGINVSDLKSGWTVEGNDIVWDDGDVMASITPMAAADCESGYVCFWENKSYTGRRLQFRAKGLRGDMRDYSFNDKMSSWRSRRSLDARWYYNYDGGGTSRCIESGTRNSDVGAGAFNFDNDEMSSFRIYADSDRC